MFGSVELRRTIFFASTTVLFSAVVLFGLAGCAEKPARDIVRAEKATGNYWRYCDLAKQDIDSDRALLVDLGECYEHGWGELPRDREVAINYYKQGARWSDPNAIAALKRLEEQVPDADLLHEEHKHIDERRADELRHSLLLAVVGTEMSISRHPRYDLVSGTLGNRSGANIAGSPAFQRYIDERARTSSLRLCALVYLKGHRVEPEGACK